MRVKKTSALGWSGYIKVSSGLGSVWSVGLLGRVVIEPGLPCFVTRNAPAFFGAGKSKAAADEVTHHLCVFHVKEFTRQVLPASKGHRSQLNHDSTTPGSAISCLIVKRKRTAVFPQV
jgi:hypothetical protein